MNTKKYILVASIIGAVGIGYAIYSLRSIIDDFDLSANFNEEEDDGEI